MNELKPCPFCGVNLTGKGTVSSGRVYISCINCEAEGPIGDDDSEMIEAWNTRASPWIPVNEKPKCNLDKDSLGVPVLTVDEDGVYLACYYGCRVTRKPNFYLFGAVVDRKFIAWQPIAEIPA